MITLLDNDTEGMYRFEFIDLINSLPILLRGIFLIYIDEHWGKFPSLKKTLSCVKAEILLQYNYKFKELSEKQQEKVISAVEQLYDTIREEMQNEES